MRNRLWMLALVLTVMMVGGRANASDEKTVTGKSGCAHCSGTIDGGCKLMLVAEDGTKWVLVGDSESYKAAMKARGAGKKMTATITGDIVMKKGADGSQYKEAKVSEVKIDA